MVQQESVQGKVRLKDWILLRYRCGVTGTTQEQNYPQAKVSVFPRSNGCKFRRKFPKDPKRPNSQFRVDEAQVGQVFRLSVKDQ